MKIPEKHQKYFIQWSQWVDKSNRYRLMGFCKCDCGKEKIVRISHMVRGDISSCGCANTERVKNLNLRHGKSTQSIHNIWKVRRKGN